MGPGPLWRAVSKRCGFGEQIHWFHVEGIRPIRVKNLRFKKYSDSCGRGLNSYVCSVRFAWHTPRPVRLIPRGVSSSCCKLLFSRVYVGSLVCRRLVFPTLLSFRDLYHSFIYAPALCLMQNVSSHISISSSHRVSFEWMRVMMNDKVDPDLRLPC